MNEEQLDIISKLAGYFQKKGKVLSKLEYGRETDQPFTMNHVRSRVGWNLAQKEAEKLMCQDPGVASEMKDIEGCARPSVCFRDDPHEEIKKSALMAGLWKQNIPIAVRKELAQIIHETDLVLKSLRKEYPHKQEWCPPTRGDAACLVLSDIHCGKLAIDDAGHTLYNRSICLDRVMRCVDKSISILTDHLVKGTVDEICILLAGDIVDGSGIYDTQLLHQDIHSVPEQVSVIAGVIWDAVQAFRKRGWKVNIYCVRGNHGRQGKYLPQENNFDTFVYQNLEMRAHYEDPDGVSVKISTTEYINFEVKGHQIHMRHISPAQTETAAAKAKLGGWKSIHDWDIMVFGHKHHPGHMSYLDADVIMNGSVVGIDDLAESMGTFSRPSQTLFGVNAKEGLSFRYNVYAEELH